MGTLLRESRATCEVSTDGIPGWTVQHSMRSPARPTHEAAETAPGSGAHGWQVFGLAGATGIAGHLLAVASQADLAQCSS